MEYKLLQNKREWRLIGKIKLFCICGGYPSPTSILDDYKLFFINNKLN
jgi:hypothetical protein